MGSTPKLKFPEATPEETALQSEQVKLLRDQRDALSEQIRQQNLLAPILFKSAGITPQMDSSGKIVGFSETEDPTKSLRDSIEKGFLERTQAALKGELPVDPALGRELDTQERTLRESLRKQLGSGYETSTAGGGRLADFTKRRLELNDAARRGDLTLAEQLGLAREGGNQQIIQNLLNQVGGINQQGFAGANALSGVIANYNRPLGNMFANRQGAFAARSANFQNDLNDPVGSWQNVGRFARADLSAAGQSFLSTARVKKHITPLDEDEYREALKKIRDTPVTRWRYNWEPADKQKHIGPILELSPDEIKADETHVSLSDYLGLTHAAVKGLDREVQTLRRALGRRA
jgi:hypothetical protein